MNDKQDVSRNDLALRIATDVLGDPSRAGGLAEYFAKENTDVYRALERFAESRCATARAEERERCAGVICLACRSGLPRTERDGRWTHDFDCAHDTYNPNGYDWDFCPADALHRLTPEPPHA